MSAFFRPRAAVFDLDGTLVDSAPDLHRAANATLAGWALAPYSLDEIKDFIGGGVANLLRRCLDGRGVAAGADIRQAALSDLMGRLQTTSTMSTLYPGVLEALRDLRAAGVLIGVCTNKDETLAARLLADVGLNGAVHHLVGADNVRPLKPDPAPLLAVIARCEVAPEETLYVGDSAVDALTARNAHVAFALHCKGYGWQKALAIGPALLFDAYAELADQLITPPA
jgi:phosphoglycolate phosphatase